MLSYIFLCYPLNMVSYTEGLLCVKPTMHCRDNFFGYDVIFFVHISNLNLLMFCYLSLDLYL